MLFLHTRTAICPAREAVHLPHAGAVVVRVLVRQRSTGVALENTDSAYSF